MMNLYGKQYSSCYWPISYDDDDYDDDNYDDDEDDNNDEDDDDAMFIQVQPNIAMFFLEMKKSKFLLLLEGQWRLM